MIPSRSFLRLALMESIALGLALSLAACGKVDASAGDGPDGGADHRGHGDDDDESDLTAPTVLSVSPDDSAVGVMPDAVIAIAFSEPMDRESVEAAWASDDIGPVTFTWSEEADQVTVTPNEPLALAEGSDPNDLDPLELSFALSDSASDRNGNSLAAPLAIDFATKRRISAAGMQLPPLTRTVLSDGTVALAAPFLLAGDLATNQQYKLFVTFLLPAGMPNEAIIERAVLAGSQDLTVNAPYSLGDLRVHHTAAIILGLAAFQAAPLASAGVFSSNDDLGAKSLDVTEAVADDFEKRIERGNRSQFRMQFASATNNDELQDVAQYLTGFFALEVTYLVD